MANSEQRVGRVGRAAFGGALALLAPFLISTSYLWLSRTYDFWSWQGGMLEFVALAASIAVGLLGILVLPIDRLSRAVIAVVYLPILSAALVQWSLAYICGEFGACM